MKKQYAVGVLALVLMVGLSGVFTAEAKTLKIKGDVKEKVGIVKGWIQDHKTVGSTLEVHINNDGKVLARGAKVTAVSGTTITAQTMFGGYAMTWTVKTDGSTQFVRKNGGASSASEVLVGDVISFAGTFDTSASTPTVNASVVKDWSMIANEIVMKGTVSSLDTGAQTFVLKKGIPEKCKDTGPFAPQCAPTAPGLDVTVKATADTRIIVNGEAGTFASLTSNERVQVVGTRDSSGVVVATKIKIGTED